MDKISVCILLTCHNRGETTLRSLNSIDDEEYRIDYLVVDDKSTDGTAELLRAWNEKQAPDPEKTNPEKTNPGKTDPADTPHRKSEGNLKIIEGNGNLYWAGGMRKGMEMLLKLDEKTGTTQEIQQGEDRKIQRIVSYDYLMMINDDVEFYPETIQKMIRRSQDKGNMPVTGATKGKTAAETNVTYGGVKYDMEKAKPRQMDITEADNHPVDTMNCNAFLLPWEIFRKAGAFDRTYVHSLADYDYGFTLKRMGYKVWLTDSYVGECDDNPVINTWRDTKLPRMVRLKKKESVKGLPRKQWYYYLKKNFGIRQAVWHSITPYIRILFGA